MAMPANNNSGSRRLVAAGELDPNNIHTPGIYVHRIFQGKNYQKRIEQRTVSRKSEVGSNNYKHEK